MPWKCEASATFERFWLNTASTADVSLRIADCDEQQVPALQSFFERVYRAGYALCDSTLLRWQFQRTPGSDGLRWHIKLAFDGSNIAACLGFVPLEITLDGAVVRGAWVVNWMVDPERQQLGLGPLLMREVTREFEVTLNIGPNRAARDVLSRMGWSDHGELPRYVAVLDQPSAAVLANAERLSWPSLSPAPARLQSSSPARVVRVERFDADATSLWDRITAAGSDTAGTRRSAEFLNWRYADHPGFRYRLFAQYQDARLTALAAYRVEVVQGMSIRVGRLVEYLDTADEGPETGSRMLAHLLDDARAEGVSVMDFFCGDRRYEEQLARNGFVADPAAIAALPLLFQPIDRSRSAISFMSHTRRRSAAIGGSPHWYVTKGDGDQDRPN
ncbi:MAG: GNAT family N-acetyltransferase [Luteitalea sp.]|nr:GNAT family N-acetyltransferase [Luteitalea sp.]